MNSPSPLLNILNKSIRIAGKKIIRDFGEIEKLQSSVKTSIKFIKIARSNLEKDLKNILEKIRPNLNIYSRDAKSSDCWIINLIDSPSNFSRGIDNFFISIILKENNKINACVLYNPIKDENFYFQEGLGGFKNNYRIRVSENKKLTDSISSFFFKKYRQNELQILRNLREEMQKKSIEIRESGSILYDISLVASGKIDCLLFSNSEPAIKDQISFIISETGGFFHDLISKEEEIYLASNKYIGKIIKEMIENIYEIQ